MACEIAGYAALEEATETTRRTTRMNFQILPSRRALAALWQRFATWWVGYQEKPNPLADARYAEHEAGWIVEKDGRVVAELSFDRIDPPWYHFSFASPPSPEMPSVLVFSAGRNSDPSILFRNRANPSVVAPDGVFFTNVFDDGLVVIRDLRP